jgi:hypothetical protein
MLALFYAIFSLLIAIRLYELTIQEGLTKKLEIVSWLRLYYALACLEIIGQNWLHCEHLLFLNKLLFRFIYKNNMVERGKVVK